MQIQSIRPDVDLPDGNSPRTKDDLPNGLSVGR